MKSTTVPPLYYGFSASIAVCFSLLWFLHHRVFQSPLTSNFSLLVSTRGKQKRFYKAETQGQSEEYFGRWIREKNIPRDSLVFATKVSGPSGQMTWIREGPTSLDASNITRAIDNGLVPN